MTKVLTKWLLLSLATTINNDTKKIREHEQRSRRLASHTTCKVSHKSHALSRKWYQLGSKLSNAFPWSEDAVKCPRHPLWPVKEVKTRLTCSASRGGRQHTRTRRNPFLYKTTMKRFWRVLYFKWNCFCCRPCRSPTTRRTKQTGYPPWGNGRIWKPWRKAKRQPWDRGRSAPRRVTVEPYFPLQLLTLMAAVWHPWQRQQESCKRTWEVREIVFCATQALLDYEWTNFHILI